MRSATSGPDYFFCIAHEPPWFELPDHVEIVATGTYQAEGRLNIRDSRRTIGTGSLGIDNYYPYLAGTAGSLYICELLQRRPTDGKSVCIFQYRKLISAQPVGDAAPNYPGMRLLDSATDRQQVSDILAACNTNLLVAHPLIMGFGVLKQYADAHHVADFLLLTHIALRHEVLEASEVAAFVNARLFIPGGVEFGIFPCDLYIAIIERMRPIIEEFLLHHAPFDTQSIYQRRALSFFLERLGSYLLISALGWPLTAQSADGGPLTLPSQNIGYMCTVSNGTQYRVFGRDEEISA